MYNVKFGRECMDSHRWASPQISNWYDDWKPKLYALQEHTRSMEAQVYTNNIIIGGGPFWSQICEQEAFITHNKDHQRALSSVNRMIR